MNSNRGFTLIEVVIATLVILIVSLGFFAWSTTIIQKNTASRNINIGYEMAIDIGERLQRMSDNNLIQPATGNDIYVGFNTSGDLLECAGATPATSISSADGQGLTIYTDPFDDMNDKLYLYDKNTCSSATPFCLSSSNINDTANPLIDHPNDVLSTDYDEIIPVRFINNTTFYAVWKVAYLPCGALTTNNRKIFITVYWMDIEPSDTTSAAVAGKIGTSYLLKTVSIVVDKTIGVE